MKKSIAALILVMVLVAFSGCVDSLIGKPQVVPTTATLAPTPLPTTENPSSTVPVADMALQLPDLPPDYILRDRSVMIRPEVSELTRDLGWRQGYFVSFYRLNAEKDDLTRIRQSISLFALENMKKVFDIEKEDLDSQAVSPVMLDEMPFPPIGSRSVAYRQTDPTDSLHVTTYTVIFTKKNIFETVTMSGTTTDYELLKDVVQKAAAKIQ